MSKPFRYWVRLVLVTTLSVTLSVNPAWAGRIFHRNLCRPATCAPATEACCFDAPMEVVVDTSCGCSMSEPAASTDCHSGCSDCGSVSSVTVPDCGCAVPSESSSSVAPVPSVVPEVEPANEMPKADEPKPEAPTEEPKVEPSKPDFPPEPAVEPATPIEPAPTPEPKSEPTPEPAPTIEPPTPEPAPPAEPAPAIEAPATEPAPMPMPTEPSPLDSLFGNPTTPEPAPAIEPSPVPEPAPAIEPSPAPEPAPQSLDSLFGDPAAPAQPAPEAPAPAPATTNLDSLFGDPAAPAQPAAEAPAPATTNLDSLFGDPAAPAQPAPEAPAPATTNLDSLFGDPAPAAEAPSTSGLFDAPATEPAPAVPAPTAPDAASGLDQLFNAPPSESAPVTPESLENLFNGTEPPAIEEKAAEPVSRTENSDVPNFDSLFGNPTSAPLDASQEEPAAPAAPTDNFDDLFKTTSIAANESFRGAEFRTWIDDTGSYEVNARLVMIYPDRVRLLKDNGKHTTVPFSRLSGSDRDYVTWVAAALVDAPQEKLVMTNSGVAK